MRIQRMIDGEIRTFTLTEEELYKAHEEHVTNFMKYILITDFDLNESLAEEYATLAYNKYCEGDGKTEYECIEAAYNEYEDFLTEERR